MQGSGIHNPDQVSYHQPSFGILWVNEKGRPKAALAWDDFL
jgi:hypothetical protein